MDLNIGAGHIKYKDYKSVDIIKGSDYIVDLSANLLPFKNETIHNVYTSHFIEHLTIFRSYEILKDCYRVMKPGYAIEIHTVNMSVIWNNYIDSTVPKKETDKKQYSNVPDNIRNHFYLNNRLLNSHKVNNPFEIHRSVYTYGMLYDILSDIGFTNIEKANKNEYHGDIDLAIRARKLNCHT